MRKKLSKTDRDFAIMRDLWSIYQEFYEPEDNEKFWDECYKAITEFTKKYSCPFACELGVTVFDELERRYKEQFASETQADIA